MAKQSVKILAFKIVTPKVFKEGRDLSVDMDRYDHHQISEFFKEILKKREKENAQTLRKKDVISLYSYNENYDNDYSQGEFRVVRVGKKQEVFDVEKFGFTGTKEKIEGLNNFISFVISKKTGVIFLEVDHDRVLSGSLLQKFFYGNRTILNDYIKSFNKANKKGENSISIFKNRIAFINSVISKDFYDEFKELVSIKKIKIKQKPSSISSIQKEIDKFDPKVNNASHELNKIDMGQDTINVEFEAKGKESFLNKLVATKFIDEVYENTKYEDIIIDGQTKAGKQKHLTRSSITKSVWISMEVDSDGVYNDPESITNKIKNEICNHLNEFDYDSYNESINKSIIFDF